jgi:hypothetical protein
MVLFFVASGPRTGTGPGPEDGRSPKDKATVAQRAQKPNADTAPGEWFPDPERGWVRLPQHDRNQDGGEHNRADNSAVKNRKDGTRWEY